MVWRSLVIAGYAALAILVGVAHGARGLLTLGLLLLLRRSLGGVHRGVELGFPQGGASPCAPTGGAALGCERRRLGTSRGPKRSATEAK